MELNTLKSISMIQMENAFAAALTALTSTDAKVAIRAVEDICDGSDRLIGQERWELAVTVTVVPPD